MITRLHQRVSRTAARLDRHHLALGIGVCIVGAAMAYVSWIAVKGVPFQDRYVVNAVIPNDSPVVKEGNAVRIAGRLAGFVRGIEPSEGNVKLRMELRPQFAPIGEDARVYVRVKSITYLTYVEIRPGDVSEPMDEGGTIPVERSSSGVDLLELVQLFDRRSRRALAATAVNAGLGVAGRGAELNAALGDLTALTPDLTSQLEAVASHPGAVRDIVIGADAVSRGVAGRRPDDVAGLLRSGSSVLGTVANRGEELGRSLDLLRPFEDEFLATAPLLDPLLEDTGALSRALGPGFAAFESSLPGFTRLLRLGGELRRQSVVLARFVNPVLRIAAPLLRKLRPTVASLDPFIAALRPIVNTVGPYRRDAIRAGLGFIGATDNSYPEGQTAPGGNALRFSPVLTCHRARDVFPRPGETQRHSRSC